MNYPLYDHVKPTKSNSSYGNYVVKYSEIHFRFFWKKSQAVKWSENYNKAINKADYVKH